MVQQCFSRQALYDLVWSGPMRSIAEKVGLSDVGLKKAVVKAGLPVPPQGYWNKVAAGKKVGARPEIPPRGFGASDNIMIGQQDWRQEYRQLQLEDVTLPPSFIQFRVHFRRWFCPIGRASWRVLARSCSHCAVSEPDVG